MFLTIIHVWIEDFYIKYKNFPFIGLVGTFFNFFILFAFTLSAAISSLFTVLMCKSLTCF